ncbi:UDP-2,3-diacylglucosamine diphosphatase [Pseudomonas oryzihabitans]|uniref:UDP-2,3-diacylglucosamine diphosphatase n=1 Tax=Pseudomonas oryzihabitans TaxID=47885 RepID=UPI0028613040|nr:UDP-2,3-diacylglucosamine diphosphatase [Pseudomonas psychrotolerans]MDR6675916.1 UDP-2,3-diacylglucosamine hydrolase [Pseudomonas psychrotolerans]
MILLVSDLHLEPQRPDIVRAFLHLLETRARGAEALYILGDLFEAWIGDDAMGTFEREIATALRRLADSGTAIYLMHGNRDFLIGKAFCRQAGCRLLPDRQIADFHGRRVLLMHGDTLCTRDEGYQKLRRILRNPLTLFVLRHLPLASRQKLARKLRNESRQQTRAKAMDITDVTEAEVEREMQAAQVTTLIHGHTHRPATHDLQVNGKPAQRIVLGDWDSRGWVLEASSSGLIQRNFELDER